MPPVGKFRPVGRGAGRSARSTRSNGVLFRARFLSLLLVQSAACLYAPHAARRSLLLHRQVSRPTSSAPHPHAATTYHIYNCCSGRGHYEWARKRATSLVTKAQMYTQSLRMNPDTQPAEHEDVVAFACVHTQLRPGAPMTTSAHRHGIRLLTVSPQAACNRDPRPLVHRCRSRRK